ncbi:ATP-dependent endonuclease [Acinetobacter baumannii]|uniref:AAA family ATPase n=1 Tax=Acinetobacter baumannii TaxID=470 RepID=UPI000DE68511|nr:AAA family ATPase [Acinetobacter baumannii]EKT9380522.1 ATP-dependent endonuclease [Acinetobacter baumannii]EKU0759086.1 ATP-dependent endonuclease [Acinetobacter baumannii]EKV8393933.1 ATP-dependent endonuclease [Acinetobacter baumannii]EKW0730437.1 ATP-dependent endonuclease [Acinetobacter baumannii]EKW0738795.1 ATP-dependent endonuclease [Acinetobacter baumannii]
MRISNIHIENFRGLKEIDLTPSQMNCLIGENNAGKSTALLAINLFLNGTRISESDYYDKSKEIFIDITFSDLNENDLNKISDEENRSRIQNIIENNTIKFRRKYKLDFTSDLLCYKKVPIDTIYKANWIANELKGKKPAEIKALMRDTYQLPQAIASSISTQTGAKEKIEELISELTEDKFQYDWENLPTGFSNTVTPMFPEPIYIPAVKDFSDETKTKESTSFGKLIKILFKQIENSPEFLDIKNSFEKLNKMLNRQLIKDENGIESTLDERLPSLKLLETEIENIFQESFSQIKLELEIPNPEVKQIFNSTQILIDDGIKTTIDYKGDGVKRTLVFSILRTYVEKLNSDNQNTDYIFLFEEPELYLHPNGQRILYNVLERLSLKDQVFVTTHSPNFFSATAKETCFIKIYKDFSSSPPCSKVKEINFVINSTYKDAFQIICYENSTPAFFSKKVLLVEGDSDLIFLKGLSRFINESYCFEKTNIPIIRIQGKMNTKRFYDFYKHFDIEVFTLLDLDILIDGFEKLEFGTESSELNALRQNLLIKLDQFCEDQSISSKINGKIISEQAKKISWQDKYKRLKELANKVKNREEVSDDELKEIDELFEFETNNKRREALKLSETFYLEEKVKLINRLYDLGYFVLNLGAIEAYYPEQTSGEDKPSKALNALEIIEKQNISYLPKIPYQQTDHCELSLIMNKIFS